MPEPWMPGLRRDPGRSAGYPRGRTRMQWVKHHDTAGTNSYEICKWGREGYAAGLCQILLPKVGVPWQFCEIDALCYDSGDWNPWGPGIEVERLGAGQTFNGAVLAVKQEATPDQTLWLGRINSWLEAEWGVPNVQYRGAQFGAQGFKGHVSHFDIAYNPDGLTIAEWDAITATNTPGDDVVTPEQMKELADWENDTRAYVDKRVTEMEGTFGQWLKDAERRIVAALKP